MRTAELVFLLLLVLYQGFLVVPRYRRLFAANYLVFLAGMALAWNLGLEGLRWQTIPPIFLLLVDLAVLFPTFKSLHGGEPEPGILPVILGGLRTVVASVALLVAVGSCVLALAFPLPVVDLSGGLAASVRIVRFPPTQGLPGIDVHLWYPASGDGTKLPRPQGETYSWQRTRAEGGLPVFWQSYLGYLPSNLVKGGKLASPANRYPVIYACLPKGQNPEDFGYLFEDLATRGFLVVATAEVPKQFPTPASFSWDDAFDELTAPFCDPGILLEPDRRLSGSGNVTDYSNLDAARKALRQLDSQPGDLLFASVDWNHQGLWSWGFGPGITGEQAGEMGISCQIHAGGSAPKVPATRRELWITGQRVPESLPQGRWFLEWPGMGRADLSDSAYLKPYLAFFGLKTQPASGYHDDVRQYQAAFFQYALWSAHKGTSFRQTVPEIPGLDLSGQ